MKTLAQRGMKWPTIWKLDKLTWMANLSLNWPSYASMWFRTFSENPSGFPAVAMLNGGQRYARCRYSIRSTNSMAMERHWIHCRWYVRNTERPKTVWVGNLLWRNGMSCQNTVLKKMRVLRNPSAARSMSRALARELIFTTIHIIKS